MGFFSSSSALVLSSVVAVTSLIFASPPAEASVSGGSFSVARYNVEVHYEPAGKMMRGSTHFRAVASERLKDIRLELGVAPQSVTVNGEPAAGFRYDGFNRLDVVPRGVIEKGQSFDVDVMYGGSLAGIPIWAETEDGGSVGVTGGASGLWMATNHDGSDRAQLSLTVDAPAGLAVVSNGTRAPVTSAGGRDVHRWSSVQPLAPDSMILGIGPWSIEFGRLPGGPETVNVVGQGLEAYARPLINRQAEMLRVFHPTFGQYPFESFGVIYVETLDPYVPNWAAQGRFVLAQRTSMTERIQAHEISHSWFGVLIQSDDLCLEECLASYAEWIWTEAADGTDLDARYRSEVEHVRNDVNWWSQTLVPGTFAVYSKGPLALHALQMRLGEPLFWTLLREWPARFAGERVTWADFESLVVEFAGTGIRPFLNQWFHGTVIPDEGHLNPVRP